MPTGRRAAAAVGLLVAAGAVAAFPASAVGAAAPSPAGACSDAPAYECRTVVVPLDRSGTLAGEVRLHVRVRAGAHDRPPVVAIAGGPGQSATALATAFERMLDPVLGERALVLVDQRGTGRSGVLRCPALERGPARPASAAARCARTLGARRAHYSTPDSVADLEAVRQALGAERIALFGVSYGSRLALAYAAAHPSRTERVVVDSPVPLAGPDPLLRSSVAAIPRVLRATCAHGCPGASSRPVRDLRRLLTALRRPGAPSRSERREAALLTLLLDSELSVGLRRRIPGAARRALGGDWAPLRRLRARLAGQTVTDPRVMSSALYATTACEELPWPGARKATPRTRMRAIRRTLATLPVTALAPFDRAAVLASPLVQLCSRWPRTSGSAPAPAVPAAATLVVAGGRDLLTPLADARALARRLPAGRLLIAARGGHNSLGRSGARACVRRTVRAFLDGTLLPPATHC